MGAFAEGGESDNNSRLFYSSARKKIIIVLQRYTWSLLQPVSLDENEDFSRQEKRIRPRVRMKVLDNIP